VQTKYLSLLDKHKEKKIFNQINYEKNQEIQFHVVNQHFIIQIWMSHQQIKMIKIVDKNM
jgi:hypothetical protein